MDMEYLQMKDNMATFIVFVFLPVEYCTRPFSRSIACRDALDEYTDCEFHLILTVWSTLFEEILPKESASTMSSHGVDDAIHFVRGDVSERVWSLNDTSVYNRMMRTRRKLM